MTRFAEFSTRFADWLDRLAAHKDVPHFWSENEMKLVEKRLTEFTDSILEDQPPPESSEGYNKAVVCCALIFLALILGVSIYGIWRAA